MLVQTHLHSLQSNHSLAAFINMGPWDRDGWIPFRFQCSFIWKEKWLQWNRIAFFFSNECVYRSAAKVEKRICRLRSFVLFYKVISSVLLCLHARCLHLLSSRSGCACLHVPSVLWRHVKSGDRAVLDSQVHSETSAHRSAAAVPPHLDPRTVFQNRKSRHGHLIRRYVSFKASDSDTWILSCSFHLRVVQLNTVRSLLSFVSNLSRGDVVPVKHRQQ